MPLLLLALIGLVAGLAGGLLGIGGTIVMIPGMNELFGPRQHLHQAAAMIVNFFIVVPAAYQHARARAIHWPVVRGIAAAAVVSVLLGVAASESRLFAGRNQVYLAGLFGVFMFCIGATDLYRMLRRSEQTSPEVAAAVPTWKAALLVGVPTGFISGLLGVGGGIMAVPLQRRLLRIPIRNAIANSATTIIVLSIVGASLKNYAIVADGVAPWSEPVKLAAILIPTAMVASFFGGKLTHTLPVRQVRLAFILLLFVFAFRMVGRALAAL